MANTMTAEEYLEERKRRKQGESNSKRQASQGSVENRSFSSADEYLAYREKRIQAENEQFAARARAAAADKYENLVNSMRPEERLELFTSNEEQYSGARKELANLLGQERYAAIEDRARNTYIPAQFGQRLVDRERSQKYAQQYQNTYVPASLAQNAIHRSGAGSDFTSYSDAMLRGEYLSRVDTNALQAELDALNEALDADRQRYNRTKIQFASYGDTTANSGAKALQKYISDYDEKQARAAQLQRDIHDSDAVKKYNAYESLRSNADFAERSQAGKSKRVQFDLLDPSTWSAGDDKYDFVNDIDGYRNAVKFLSETSGQPTSYGAYSPLSHITDEEKAMYNYLYATEGKEAAEEYLKYIEEGLNYRQGKAEADIVGDSLLKAAGYGIRTGAERFGTGIAGMFEDEAKAPAASEYGAQFVRENLADTGLKLPEWMGGASIGQTVFDLSNTAGNLAPSLLLSVLTAGAGAPTAVAGGVSSASMGLSAGGNAKAQALRDGYTPEQATRYGVLIGASEGALQYLLGGIGKLGGKLTGGVAKKAIQNIDSSLLRIAATGAIKMAGEGTEEYLQEILDPIYRNLLFNENNQIDLTDPEAVYSFLLGALTAGVMDGSEIIREGIAARPSSLPNVNGAIAAADAAQNIQSERTAMQNAAQGTEQYVYTDETTGLPMVGTRKNIASEVTPEAIARNKAEVAGMEPVAEMDGSEFPKGSTGIVDQVTEFFKSIGNRAVNPSIGQVTLDRRGAKSSLAHGIGRNKAIAFKAVPDVIRNGKIIDFQADWKGRGYDTVVIAAPVVIKGETFYEGAILIRENRGTSFYLHEVTALKNKDTNAPIKTGSKAPSDAKVPSLISLLDEIRKVNAPENNIGLVPMEESLEKSNTAGGIYDLDNAVSESDQIRPVEGATSNAGDIPTDTAKTAQTSVATSDSEVPGAVPDTQYPETNIQEVDRALSEIKWKQRELERIQAKLLLTDADRAAIDAVFKGGITLDDLRGRANFDDILEYYNARSEVEKRRKVINEYNKKRREHLRDDAMNAIENSDHWKDKRIGALYERETQERNIRDITGNNQDAERIIAGYIQPIHDNEAKRTQYINDMNDRMLALKKNEKGESVGLNKWESKATQLIGERIDYEERLTQLEKRGVVRSAEARLALDGLKLVNEEYSKLMEKHADKIDLKACEAALPTVREIFDQVFQDMNNALVRNGYTKVEHRKNYFPHFIGREYDSAGKKIAKAFGFNLTNMELPTDIAGLTSAFRPGKTWFSHALERTGVKTEFDLYGAFDSYIRDATDIIFHTDDIQRLRALDNAIRYKYSDEGRRARMRELMERDDITPEEREAQIHALYIDEKGKSMTSHLSGYVSNLTEYTNLLANKKSFYDRAAEKRWGRTIYELANWYQNRYAGNTIAGNLGVALSNFIPITQATSEVGTITLSRAMRDTAKAFAKDDGFSERSVFLTNRRGTDRLASDLISNVSNKLSIPFEAVDRFASETLVRAKYAQNLKSGMTAETAMENADAWAAGLMADRSKGALPTIFGSKSPLTKAFTMFQVESNNQLSYMFKDVPRDMKAKGVAAVAAALFKMFLAAWMYNELDEQITGRRRALDPLHMIAEAVGVDWKTENVIPRITGVKTAEEAPLFSYEPQTWVGAAESIGKNVVDQTPFFGSLLGGDGGRSPAAGAAPDLWRIAKTLGNDEADGAYKGSVIWDELKKPLFYILPPFAGGQVKKAIEGIQTVMEGGSYKKDKEGNDILRFRTDQTGFDYAQAALFGPWALPEGRENIAQGFPVLSAPDTTAYKNAIANDVDGAHFLLLLDEYKNLEPIKDADGNTKKSTNQQFREILFRDSSLTPEQKEMIDRDVIRDEKTADYTSKDRFTISTTPMEFMHIPKDDNAYERFTENIESGMSAEDAALVETWARKFIHIETYTDEDGNEIKAAQQKREMLFNDPNLTPEQKEMIDRQVIMGDGKNAKPADYSSSEAMMEASQLKGSHADKVKFFEAAGGTAEKYLAYYNLYSELEPTKDINGEEIAGSREETLRSNIMNDDDLTPAQKRQLDEALTGGKTRNYISWFAFELTKISKTAYKRGKAYVAAGISEAKAIQIEQWMEGREYKKADLKKYLSKLNLTDSEIEAVLEARY